MGGELASDSCLVGTLSTDRDRKAVRALFYFLVVCKTSLICVS